MKKKDYCNFCFETDFMHLKYLNHSIHSYGILHKEIRNQKRKYYADITEYHFKLSCFQIS